MSVYQMHTRNEKIVCSQFSSATTVPSQTIGGNFEWCNYISDSIKRTKNNHMSSSTCASMQPTKAGK